MKTRFISAMRLVLRIRPSGFGWMRKAASKDLPSNCGRSNLTINGALSWPDKAFVHREEKVVAADAMIALFEDILAKHAPRPCLVSIILDNARYNHARKLKEWLQGGSERIRLVYSPSYAPNRNLIERLWLFLKKKSLWNRYIRRSRNSLKRRGTSSKL